MSERNLKPQFNLDGWHVDTLSNRLRKDNTEIKLESKVMAVLNYLAQHQNELVSREDLEQAIWGDTIVGYDALTRCIAQLRKSLNDDRSNPRYIETISKKGYRLVAEVSNIDLPEPNPDSNEPKVLKPHTVMRSYNVQALSITALLVLLSLVYNYQPEQAEIIDLDEPVTQYLAQPSIVVLPFKNLNNNPEQRYFSDGVTADITTALSKLSGLLVISESSANRISRVDNLKETASSVGARYVLEGTVRRIKNRIRVNVNLIDSRSDIYLWSEKYDRELSSVFDVQDDITSNIIQALSIKLTEEEKRRTAHRYTVSILAYDDFLRGQANYAYHSQEKNLLARQYFQQAIERDSGFARAYSAMALTYVAQHRYAWGEQLNQQLDEALRLANKGKALDEELPQAYWVLGYVHLFRREFEKAEQVAGQAIKLDPNYADSYLTIAVCKIHAGESKAAVAYARKSMLINPIYPAAYASILGQAYFFNENYELAVTNLQDAIDRNINLLSAHVFLIASLSKLNQMEEAEWAAEKLKLIDTDFSIDQIDKMLAIGEAQGLDDLKKQLQRVGF